ncbi:FAD-binding protein [Rhodococcus sp. B50]|uniref:FAD-binding protein n=1 Tax=Rhodococcus sp. B50 TaxID=2682847 RepID=UPI0035AB88A4
MKVEASALGTVGGPKTDAKGRALDTEGEVIPGLYAAGNSGGAPTKGFYAGAGVTSFATGVPARGRDSHDGRNPRCRPAPLAEDRLISASATCCRCSSML